jgi:NAD(P)-dependent dehydrogenase (short-subunit alcohol dehydrogenase family)
MPTVLITGANRGIGLALSREYVDREWNVIGACRSPDQASGLKQLAATHDVRIVPLDVRDRGSIDALAHALADLRIDVLLNNAGVLGHDAPLADFDAAAWRDVLEINLLAPIDLARAFLPHVAASDQKKIVNITSGMGSIAGTRGDQVAYRTSKAALNMAMRSLAVELKTLGVSVGLLTPGVVATDMTSSFVGYKMITPEESARGLADRIGEISLETSGEFRRYNGDAVSW